MSNLPKASVFCMYIRNICLAFLSMFFMIDSQSFATGIPATDGEAQPADCDSDTLDTTSGTANLRADFEANRIDLRWYNNNTLLNVSSTSSDKCTYDTTIDLPTNPTKTGYTFKGWKVRPEYDFSTLPTNVNGTEYRAVNKYRDWCWRNADQDDHKCTDAYADLDVAEWKVVFSWGTVYGMSLCSSTNGVTTGKIDTPVTSWDSSYAWCKITGYKPANGNIKYSPNTAVPWVFVGDTTTGGSIPARACTYHAMRDCSTQIMSDSSFRQTLFGQTSN